MPRILILSDHSSEYSRLLLKGVVRYSKEHGQWTFYRMPLNYREMYGEEGVISWAKRWKADAAIVAQVDNLEVKKLCSLDIPIIFHNHSELNEKLPNLTGNYIQGGEMAARYFMNRGYENFAFYGTRQFNWSDERLQGFVAELATHGCAANCYHGEILEKNDQWNYDHEELSRWLKSLPKPVAIFASADYFAIHITETCRLQNIRVPDEVAVLGVDDDQLICEISDPPLSSIRLDIENGGYRTAEMLHKLITNEITQPFDIVVNHTEVIERRSTDRYATTDKCLLVVINFIHRNYHRPISVSDLLAISHTSRRVLEKRFRQQFRTSLYQYILNLRIEKLAHELIHSDAPLYQLAEQCGFDIPANIARVFRKAKGSSPAHYRSMYKLH